MGKESSRGPRNSPPFVQFITLLKVMIYMGIWIDHPMKLWSINLNWQHHSFISNFILLSRPVIDRPKLQGWFYGFGCLLVIRCSWKLVTLTQNLWADKVTIIWMAYLLCLVKQMHDRPHIWDLVGCRMFTDIRLLIED